MTVTLPRGIAKETGHAFVRSKARWIERTVSRQKKRAAARRIIRWATGELLPFLGRTLTLVVTPGNSRVSAFLRGDVLHVCCAKQQDAARVGEEWYRRQALLFFEAEVERITKILGVTYGRIAIKQQSTLWGSCSKKGNLNFNRRLLFAPEEVARYVAVHECAHLVHLNHSPAFWSLVASLCPGHREHRTWLREQGMNVG